MNAEAVSVGTFRLGWILVHALWMGTLVGLATAVGLRVLRHQRPQIQYAFACIGLLLMVALPLLAGWQEPLPHAGVFPLAETIPLPSVPVASEPSWMLALRATIHRALPALTLAWSLGAGGMTLRLAAGMLYLRLRVVAPATEAPAALIQSFQTLAHRAGFTRLPRLRLAEAVRSPLVVGWMRPLVLLPPAALLQLSPAALEAVLAHELAHLRRHDALMNLLQSLAEVLLFFHPAAWWLNRRVRDLREHCCDDDAVALIGTPVPLAEGLSCLALMRRTSAPEPEPALGAAKGPLMTRIHRLLQPQPTTAAWIPLAALALAGTLAFAQTTGAAPKPKASPKPRPAAASKPVPKPVEAAVSQDAVQETDFSKIKVRHKPPVPTYPAEAREQKIQGVVVVSLLVDETGTPIEVKATEGPEALRPTAEAFAKDWRFNPYRVKGKATKARFTLTMPFKLR